MGQLMSLAQSFGDTPPPSPEPIPSGGFGNPDPKLLQIAMSVMQEYNRTDDDTIALLLSLRPFLKEERLAKMDQAIQFAKIFRAAKLALRMWKGGEGDV